MAYFDCQIVQGGGGVILTVTCYSVYAGTTITATDGETTLQATCPSSSPYTVDFKLPNSGSWTISGTVSGQTKSITVVIPDSATLTPPIPTGSTVTPVNDIQTWLHCANVWDKTYTTISQVLSDTSLVTTLIASNNAADYMARSTSWASSVTANSSAMTKIGANDYCANKLLADSTWSTAICNSTYFESVLTSKAPTMTSNTTPSGVVSATSYQSGYDAYKAFDGVISDASAWIATSSANQRLSYQFTKQILAKKIVFTPRATASASNYVKDYKIQGSNNGNSWTDLYSGTNSTGTNTITIDIPNNMSKYSYLAIFGVNTTTIVSGGNISIKECQFYGR